MLITVGFFVFYPMFSKGQSDFSCIKLYSVNFSGNYDIVKDTDRNFKYEKDHWLDNDLNGVINGTGDHDFPICYKKEKIIKVKAKFKIDQNSNGIPPEFQNSLMMKGECEGQSDGGNIKLEIIPEKVKINSGEIIYSSKTKELPESIQYYPEFRIAWSISFDQGQNYYKIGMSNNKLYIILKAPDSNNKLYQTCVHIACSTSVGKRTESEVVESVYKYFRGRAVSRADNEPLFYWKENDPKPAPEEEGFQTWGLLFYRNATCGAWADFFKDILGSQGIESQLVNIYPKQPPKTMPNQKYFPLTNEQEKRIDESFKLYDDKKRKDFTIVKAIFFVKKWKLPEPGHFINDNNVEIRPVPAQGNLVPRSWFANHAIVRYNNKFYDPSYAQDNSPYVSVHAWEEDNLDGFGVHLYNPKGPNGEVLWRIWMDKVNSPNEETMNYPQ